MLEVLNNYTKQNLKCGIIFKMDPTGPKMDPKFTIKTLNTSNIGKCMIVNITGIKSFSNNSHMHRHMKFACKFGKKLKQFMNFYEFL